MIRQILRSLIITCAVSSIVAYFLTHFDIAFLKSFLLTGLLQFIGWYFIGYFAQVNAVNEQKRLEADMYKEFSKQFSDVTCAFCNSKNNVNIKITGPNSFDCVSCDKKNSVYVNLEVVQTTTPVADDVEDILNELKADGV